MHVTKLVLVQHREINGKRQQRRTREYYLHIVVFFYSLLFLCGNITRLKTKSLVKSWSHSSRRGLCCRWCIILQIHHRRWKKRKSNPVFANFEKRRISYVDLPLNTYLVFARFTCSSALAIISAGHISPFARASARTVVFSFQSAGAFAFTVCRLDNSRLQTRKTTHERFLEITALIECKIDANYFHSPANPSWRPI